MNITLGGRRDLVAWMRFREELKGRWVMCNCNASMGCFDCVE